MQDKFDLHEWNKKRYLGELDIDQNINKDDEGSSFNITRGGDDPKIGAEEESDANVVGENKTYLNQLADDLSSKYPYLDIIFRCLIYFIWRRIQLIYQDMFLVKLQI